MKKPAGSRVLLTKNPDLLKISINLTGFKLQMLGSIVFLLVLDWITIAAIKNIGFTTPYILAIMCLSFGVTNFFTLLPIFRSLFGQVQLSIDLQQISLTYNLFGCIFRRFHPVRREDITKLEYIKISPTYLLGILVEGSSQINVWVGTQNYTIGENLTSSELEWLANELSDWLGLPIEKIK